MAIMGLGHAPRRDDLGTLGADGALGALGAYGGSWGSWRSVAALGAHGAQLWLMAFSCGSWGSWGSWRSVVAHGAQWVYLAFGYFKRGNRDLGAPANTEVSHFFGFRRHSRESLPRGRVLGRVMGLVLRIRAGEHTRAIKSWRTSSQE